MASPKHQQVWDALKTLLGGIVGDGGATYNYTVDAAIDSPALDSRCLNPGKSTIYVLVPQDSDVDPFTFTRTRVVAEVELVMARALDDTTEDPFNPPTESRIKVQNKLVQDATKRINSDYKLGGAALRVAIVGEVRNAGETYYAGWVISKLLLRVEYEYDDDEP